MKIRKKDSPQVNPQPCRRSAIVNGEITAKHTTPDTRKLGEELDGEKAESAVADGVTDDGEGEVGGDRERILPEYNSRGQKVSRFAET